ncbi:NAD-dependent epimerase/dehydratase family protein [Arthrobacter zhaoxinii]|uniref:NAD-dependent epimerase/dehydratase family protein n=1 Tax=Arthrobacter zhaoxinii TaxID=2964616 RepID=UPI00210495BC|nr:NAD-dependent epimerase/dehydratase family protein [Arthrobacter zhaoxinii]MCQ2001035.1 NAD-dependent epimerase/dehydratase family protein [Arthrobacter zhaoxinii]
MKQAVILGGTGVLGQAMAHRLLGSGWEVRMTGRNASKMPAALRQAGAAFVSSDRRSARDLAHAIGQGADLLVDAACYTAADAELLLPHLGSIGSAVMLSSKAVYVDDDGNHVNSDVAPRFERPVQESQQIMKPSHGNYDSREGYGANKVAAEQVLLDSGHPVTVIRASKVHGAGAVRPREWMFVKRVLDRRPAVFLAGSGAGGDHTTAAVNTAALVQTVAGRPGRRILNSADPDAPTAREIARTVAAYLGHDWEEILLGATDDPGLGAHPWDLTPPLVLDTQASLALGYRPVGTYAETVPAAVDWLLSSPAHQPAGEDPFFTYYTDYAREDAYLAAR